MSRCASFVHSHRHDSAWSLCTRPALRGGLLCEPHREALEGALMGILHAAEPIHATQAESQKDALEARAARIALENSLALLDLPPARQRRIRIHRRPARREAGSPQEKAKEAQAGSPA